MVDTQAVLKGDGQFVHPWENIEELGNSQRTVLAGAEGVYLIDSEGRRYLDGPAGMWCVNVGYGRQEIADAMSEQAMRLAYFSPWSFVESNAATLAARLSRYTPGDLDHIFFTTGGSTAVDSALRFVQFMNHVLGRPEKQHIISRRGGYHGSTYLAAAVSGKMSDKINMEMGQVPVHHVAKPRAFDRAAGTTEQDFADLLVAEIEDKIAELGAENVAAFIAEPVMGSGGVIIHPGDYLQQVREVCKRCDIVYISDEVVTGFGRLGHIFASEDVFGIVPDIITFAKGLTSGYVPMGGVAISDALVQRIKDSGADSQWFLNGFTYSGHPVAAAAAHANIDIIEREDLLAHVHDVREHFATRMRELEELDVVAEVRVTGLMAGAECNVVPGQPDEERDEAFMDEVDKSCQARGLLLRPVYNTAVLSPPLIISKTQIDEMVDILKAGFEDAMSALPEMRPAGAA